MDTSLDRANQQPRWKHEPIMLQWRMHTTDVHQFQLCGDSICYWKDYPGIVYLLIWHLLWALIGWNRECQHAELNPEMQYDFFMYPSLSLYA